MNLCAVAVWYNPDATFVENIRSYASRVGRVYVIDNSAQNNAALLSDVENAVYVPNGENRGIAVALNQGCERALADGFDWVMTMDQDSHWESKMLDEYLRLCEEYADERTVSFASGTRSEIKPNPAVLQRIWTVLRTNSTLRCILGKKSLAELETSEKSVDVEFVDKIITSGNILSLSAWQTVGKFLESLFIDEVDHEFCFRLREHGYEIVKFPSIKMEHRLGEQPKKGYFFPLVSYHSGVRLFYIYRNCAYEKKLHPEYFKKCGYLKGLRRQWLEVILNLRFSQLKYMVRGGYCARHGRLGRYEDWYTD